MGLGPVNELTNQIDHARLSIKNMSMFFCIFLFILKTKCFDNPFAVSEYRINEQSLTNWLCHLRILADFQGSHSSY